MKNAGNGGEKYQVEGRTVRELESYLSGKQAGSQDRIVKALAALIAVALLLILPGSIIWDLKQDIASLRAENTRLGQDNSSLQKQLAGGRATNGGGTNTVAGMVTTAKTAGTGTNTVNATKDAGNTASGSAPRVDAQQKGQIKAGDIPPDGLIHHAVRGGEYLSLISQQYYGTIKYTEHLARLNGIDINSQLHIGQIIKLPRQPDKSWIE